VKQPATNPMRQQSLKGLYRFLWGTTVFALLSGCSLAPGSFAFRADNAPLVDGPPIEDVVTPFDEALACLDGRIMPGITFAVGQVVDSTGKESYADGGSGRFITQGAGDMVQSALFRAGLTVINRRDPTISVTETQWGIRDLQEQVPVNFYITGSINSLDFIPGGGFSATIAGAGPRFRQNRILIGLDLSMTDAFTGRIVANVPLQKQIFSREIGASLGRFFGDTLVSLDVGGQEREAVHFALRQMMNLATFQLLGQLMNDADFAPCRSYVSPVFGTVEPLGPTDPTVLVRAAASSEGLAELRAALFEAQTGQAPVQQSEAEPQPSPQEGGAQAQATVQEQLREVMNQTSIFAARSIAASEESLATPSRDIAAQKAAEAMQLMAASTKLLQRAAEMGLSGPEGDAVAVVVERAIQLAQQASAAATAAPVRNPPPAIAEPVPQSGSGSAAAQAPPGSRADVAGPGGLAGETAAPLAALGAAPAAAVPAAPVEDPAVRMSRITFYLRLVEAAADEAMASSDPAVVRFKAAQAARYADLISGLFAEALEVGLSVAARSEIDAALRRALTRVAQASAVVARLPAARRQRRNRFFGAPFAPFKGSFRRDSRKGK